MAEAELTTIARPYARAAFSFALDQDKGLVHWSKALLLLAALVEDEKVKRLLDNPRLTAEAQARTLADVCGDDMDANTGNFVRLLADNDRIKLLPAVSGMFEQLKANYEKTMKVNVTSAYEVSEDEKSRLAKALQKMLQKEIELETQVDKSLIGGVVIKAEDTVIDNSVRGKLGKLTRALG